MAPKKTTQMSATATKETQKIEKKRGTTPQQCRDAGLLVRPEFLERFGWRRAKTMEVRCYEAPFDEGESVYLVASGSPEAKGRLCTLPGAVEVPASTLRSQVPRVR